jgi:hypothetical protein
MKKVISISVTLLLAILVTVYFYNPQSSSLMYPIWAGNVVSSQSMDKVNISFSTGKVKNGKFVPASSGEKRRVAELVIPKAYIDWKPYLRRGAISSMDIDAALPNLLPHDLWKKEYLDSIIEKKGKFTSEDRKLAHQQWIKISFGLYGFGNAMCKNECTREEHNQEVMNHYFKKYDQLLSADESIGLNKYISSASSSGGDEFFLPEKSNMKHYYIKCDSSSGKYKWCEANTLLNNDMYLRYQFEKKHLAQWRDIDNKVRALVGSFLISHETQN